MCSKDKILITGTRTGIGRFLYEKFQTDHNIVYGLHRDNPELLEELGYVDLIIHCAFNKSYSLDGCESINYLNDNIELTRKLLQIPHTKFIYCSSIAVYRGGGPYYEDEPIRLDNDYTLYANFKIMNECLVQNSKADYMILRLANLLGDYSRTTVNKIMVGEKISLTADSVLNVVLYDDVLNVINKVNKKIVNVVSKAPATIREICTTLGSTVEFGPYISNCGVIDNSTVKSIIESTTLENIVKFRGIHE
jgi:nucleoside-diphosphate-sugar epimerase